MPDNKRLMIDGKPVRKFLFSRMSRVMYQGCIPTDDGRKFIVMAQVEAFNVDHALERLINELFPMVPKKDWELIDELDPEHDIGMMGSSHPLLPLQMMQHRRIQ